jgi:signal transduction histidine kinase/CheY-like chemotaxis protein
MKDTEESKLQKLIDFTIKTAKLTVWEYDIQTHSIKITDETSVKHLQKMTGFSPFITDVPNSIIPFLEKESGEKLSQTYLKIDNGEPFASCDIWYKERTGFEPLCEQISLMTLYDNANHPVSALGISQNITAQKNDELKYRKSYQTLADNHPFSLGSFHLNLTKNLCSDGKSPFDFVLTQQKSGTCDGYFKAFSELIADDKIKKDFFETFQREKLIASFYNGTTSVVFEYPFINKNDNDVYWREGLLYMLENPSTHDIEAVTYATDINDKKKIELATEAASSESCDYISLINVSKRTSEFLSFRHYTKIDNFLHKKTNYDEDLSYFIEHYIYPDDKKSFAENTQLEHIAQAVEKNKSYIVTFKHCGENQIESRKQIRYCWLDHFKREIVAVQTDITESYNLEQDRLQKLQEALVQAETANNAKTEFISRISHDIRTPIGAITNMTDFALEDIDNPAKLRNDLEKIKTSNMFLLSLINDVLDISKIDSGKIELHPEPYPFDEYIENMKQMFEPLCQEKGINFIIAHKPNCGILIGDKIRINQIVFNILSNAVKYTPKGGTVIYDSHSHNIDSNTIQYEYTIRDTGIGMSSEYQKKLFQPFTQDYTNPNRPKAESGTGLGLSIVKRLLNIMGGTIQIESELGKGTNVTVSIKLPMMTEEDFKKHEHKTEEQHELQKKKITGTVLVAEDNEINREIATRILEDFGLSVVTAENGAEAVEAFLKLKPGSFRAILMDLQMPIMNGYEAVEKIRSLQRPDSKTIPIYAMTANAFTEAAELCKKSGMNGQILKPIDPSLLYTAMSRAQ